MTHSNEALTAPIYLDHQSTTPCDPRVATEMFAVLKEEIGNPHSIEHFYGNRAAKVLSTARERIAESLAAFPSEIVFCSGATEANNLMIRGFEAERLAHRMIMATAENDHKSILNAASHSTNNPAECNIISVDRNGIINLEELSQLASKFPIQFSISWVNSELGVVQPIKEIARIIHKNGGLFHVDASQALGRLPINFDELEVDALSISSHKCYGPKGIGALLIREDLRKKLIPLIAGGGQENGLRSGTVPTFLTSGFARACELAVTEWKEDEQRISILRTKLMEAIIAADPNCGFNGKRAERIAGSLNITFSNTDADALISKLYKTVAISRSSACNSGSVSGSHVLAAIGLDDAQIRRTIRLCIGRFNSLEEIQKCASTFSYAISNTTCSNHA